MHKPYASLSFIEKLAKKFKQYYPVYCAWCRDKKRITICGISTVPNSSTICPKCEKEFFGDWK